ncbi:uncharacterized protein LOC129612228 [Condylostylus longicornis]|uniref:uncharacterized protein LOC129612228 n=1 Tax=Condylostylus longicornis TaxID=2530218 RepID=UPI00244E2D5D|nr:uncharacterized protein LOC129612228 [Condylostylus longicornis]
MGDLNYKHILVILVILKISILSAHSVSNSDNETQIKNHYRHKTENHHLKLIKENTGETDVLVNSARHLDQDVDEFDNDSSETENTSTHDAWERKSKPLRNIFMGIYKNYKSTYLGNRTSSEYRKSMHDGWASETSGSSKLSTSNQSNDNDMTTTIQNNVENNSDTEQKQSTSINSDGKDEQYQSKRTKLKRKKKKKKKNKGSVVKKDEPLLYNYDGEYRYNIGPGVNISLDMNTDIVSVNLDEDCLKEILLGRWDDENEGRGKKYEMISKILPLFILPFLIQSAIIPFLVTKLKLLLIKSILVGKLAIFLLVISAIKNNQKVATYEPAPAYWAAEPSRRSEIYNGYRVEGRPTTWVQ